MKTMIIDPSTNDKIVALSKLKPFPDDRFHVTLNTDGKTCSFLAWLFWNKNKRQCHDPGVVSIGIGLTTYKLGYVSREIILHAFLQQLCPFFKSDSFSISTCSRA